MIRFLASAFMALFVYQAALAGETGGRLPLLHSLPDGLKDADTIIIDGKVEGGKQVSLVLRIDDASSRDYASRANIERSLPPGPFHWEVGARGLRASSGRVLDLQSVRGLRLFGIGDAQVSIGRFEVKSFPPLSSRALAYSFGAEDAPLFPGFEQILPTSPMITAGHPTAIRRPAPDPLIASGIAGVETLKVPWPEPRARVTLWTEDPGEWEMLPHPLGRRIRVAGTDFLYELYNPDEWFEKRYLRGLRDEHSKSDDAWTAYGQKRGGLVSFETPVGPDGIVIELAGDSPAATFVNAIVVEPAGQTAARDEAEARRAAWYRNTWPVVSAKEAAAVPETHRLRATAAPGSGVHIAASVKASADVDQPDVKLNSPQLGPVRLGARIWAAQRRLERQAASDTVLTLADNMLRADTSALPLRHGKSRRYDLWITVPAGAPPGLYKGTLGIAQTNPGQIPIEIEVLPVSLPPLAKAAGFYLDASPQWGWFWGLNVRRKEQLACDLKFLESFGILGNAPALAAPIAEGREEFLADMEIAAASHTAAPWLAYSAAKEVYARVGAEESAAFLKDAEASVKKAGLPPPIWSVADEPSNADSRGFNLQAWVNALRAGVPGILLGAQLNTPADAKLAPTFDVAIINQGFGIDEATISGLKHSGPDVWLYNTGLPRATAGLWLWLTEASRYVQWHARMPTADPFDPLDGREGDVQMILPSAEACTKQPNIHRDLLRMADGLTDQRWLLWLSAQKGAEAEALHKSLRQKFGGRFERVSSLTAQDLDTIRGSIIDLARKAKLSSQ